MHPNFKLTFVVCTLALAACQPSLSDRQAQWQEYNIKPHIAGSISEQRHAVYFATDVHELSPNEIRSLQAFAAGVKNGSLIRIRINGHADLRGTDPYNMRLSMKRAESVERLLHEAGMTNVKLEVDSFGEHAPAAIGQNAESLALNRRVELIAETVALNLEGCAYTNIDHSQDATNQTHPRLGCANLGNLATMIADPSDLLATKVIGNQAIGASDSVGQFGAIDRYRKREIPPLPDSGGS